MDIEKYTGLVIKLSRELTRNKELQQDLQQEGYMAILESEPKFDKSLGCEFSTFAYTCAKNRMLNYLKKDKTNTHCRLNPNMEPVGRDKSNLFDALSEFPERETYVFKEIAKGANYKDIAKDLGVSPATVSRIVSKNKEQLYDCLRNY